VPEMWLRSRVAGPDPSGPIKVVGWGMLAGSTRTGPGGAAVDVEGRCASAHHPRRWLKENRAELPSPSPSLAEGPSRRATKRLPRCPRRGGNPSVAQPCRPGHVWLASRPPLLRIQRTLHIRRLVPELSDSGDDIPIQAQLQYRPFAGQSRSFLAQLRFQGPPGRGSRSGQRFSQKHSRSALSCSDQS